MARVIDRAVIFERYASERGKKVEDLTHEDETRAIQDEVLRQLDTARGASRRWARGGLHGGQAEAGRPGPMVDPMDERRWWRERRRLRRRWERSHWTGRDERLAGSWLARRRRRLAHVRPCCTRPGGRPRDPRRPVLTA